MTPDLSDLQRRCMRSVADIGQSWDPEHETDLGMSEAPIGSDRFSPKGNLSGDALGRGASLL
jgi:hypothetical protein